MSERPGATDEALGTQLLESIYETWIEPELRRRRLQMSRREVRRVLVELDPDERRPSVKINEEADLVASVRATRDIAAGEPVAEADFDKVEDLRPAQVGQNSGWICFAVIKGEVMIAFDFRYNKTRAQRLIQLARGFLSAARAATPASPGVASDTAFSAAELSVQAQMLIQQQATRSHRYRQDWIESWTRLQNAPSAHASALRELHDLRAAGRYGDVDLEVSEERLNQLLATAEEMIDLAETRIGQAR